MADVDTKKDQYSDDSLSSSDSEDDGRPPPMIQIERSADLGALKSALFTMKDETKKEAQIEERLGKDVLSSIASSFEKPRERSPKEEKEKIVVDKEQYSSFKQKFENIDQEMAKEAEERKAQAQAQMDIQGAGKETLTQTKSMFEKAPNENEGPKEDRKIEIERSEADRKRVEETFFGTSDKEEPRDCAVCGKMVYPVEKVQANKRVYHKGCFKCHKCQHALSVQGYWVHEGKLYCKPHIMEIYRPELGLAHEGAFEGDGEEPDEEEDYAVVAKPKMLDPSVIRSGLKSADDLENVPKLQAAKAKWAESAEQANKVEKRSGVEADLIQQGKVKSRLNKFVEGGDAMEGEEEEDEEDEAVRDPNIVRGSKKKEAIHVDVGAKAIKGKWEAGTVETAQMELQNRDQELDEIKKGVKVKERFKERTGDEEDLAQRRSYLDDEQLDTTFTKTAKERFQKGEAFQDTAPVEKTAMDDIRFAELGNVKKRFETGEALADHATERTAIDARCAEMGNIKAAFEQSKAGDSAAAEAKRQLIQEEFNRIKSERQEGDEEGQNADMGSIKKRFEEGTAFQTAAEKKPDEQLEIKVAGKAREKFRQIDQDAPKEPVINQAGSKEPSKWAKEKGSAPEPINRRVLDDAGDEEPEEYEVKSLLSKFKNIEQGKAEGEQKTPKFADEELAAMRVEAKNLKDRFEKGGEAADEQTVEEKRKQIEEEFKRIKEMKESQKAEQQEEPEEQHDEADNQDLAVAAEHAQKARAKWDKIQRKEAKKAQKAAATAAKGGRVAKPRRLIVRTPDPVFCVVCTSKVYQMEKLECDGRYYHRPCFRCTECGLTLRLESYASAPNGCVYCRNHYKTLFNNMSRPLYDGRQRGSTPVN